MSGLAFHWTSQLYMTLGENQNKSPLWLTTGSFSNSGKYAFKYSLTQTQQNSHHYFDEWYQDLVRFI